MSAPKVRLDSIDAAVADIAAGRAVVVVDDEHRENEGDLVFAASKSTPELMTFTIRYSSGVICVPMTAETLDRLAIPLMTPHNRERLRTAYTVSVDARDGVTTGISAADRSHTVRVLTDSATVQVRTRDELTAAAISAPIPRKVDASCTTTARPVSATHRLRVPTSRGAIERRSTTPTETPSASAASAAASATFTLGP